MSYQSGLSGVPCADGSGRFADQRSSLNARPLYSSLPYRAVKSTAIAMMISVLTNTTPRSGQENHAATGMAKAPVPTLNVRPGTMIARGFAPCIALPGMVGVISAATWASACPRHRASAPGRFWARPTLAVCLRSTEGLMPRLDAMRFSVMVKQPSLLG
jgi:hypothetical protein